MSSARAKALVLMTSPLDMIVHGLRAVESFRSQLPRLEVTWVTRRYYEPLVASFDCVDRTIVFHRSGPLISSLSLVREIRRERYDFVLDFEGHARTGAMCAVAKGDRKIGRRDAREGATFFYGELVRPPENGSRHALDAMLEFGRIFGLAPELKGRVDLRDRPDLPTAWDDAESKGLRVCLFPSRFKMERTWPDMLRLGRKLAEQRADVSVFLLGMEDQESSSRQNSRLHGLHDLRGQATWPQICRMLETADLTIANDNGPAQLAGAFGQPNLTLYSFVLPERRGSYPQTDRRNAILRAPRGEMSQLEFADVWRETIRLLD